MDKEKQVKEILEYNEEIIKICYYYLKKIGVDFKENIGNYTICEYNNEKYKWTPNNPFKLYHKNKWEHLDFFKEISKVKTFKKAYQNKCADDLEEIFSIDDKELYNIVVDTPILGKHEKEVQHFLEKYNILKIQSAMATQKTNIIKECIKQSNAKNMKTLIITTKVSLANESYQKYKDLNFHIYNKNTYKGCSNLIVQFDSLYKYDIENFDIVIIDEITSLLLYITTPYKGKEDIYNININILLNLDLHSKIVLLDAFIIHNPFKGKTFSIYNKFRENLNVIEYTDKNNFISTINRYSNSNSLSVSSNEKKFLISLKYFLEKYNKKVLLLTGDTPNKEGIIQNIQHIKSLSDIGYDVLLYSPVVTVGVSLFFNVDNHFHYDNSTSIDPVNSIQMIRRVRNAKNIHYYLQGKVSYKQSTTKKIQKSYIMKYFTMQNIRGDFIGFTRSGKKLLEILKIKNIFENTHKYSFRKLTTFQFSNVILNEIKKEKINIHKYLKKRGYNK